MQLAQILPFWNELTPAQRTALQDAAQTQHCAAQTRLNAKESCMGLVVIRRPEEETDGLSYEQALDDCRKAVDPCKRSR